MTRAVGQVDQKADLKNLTLSLVASTAFVRVMTVSTGKAIFVAT